MVDVGMEPAPLPALLSTKKQQLLSAAMKRTSEWIFSQEIPSDITVHVGGASFSLHKFPLVSKCGYIRRLVSEAGDPPAPALIELPDLPGGAEAFELAAKFCYGINFEINTDNVAALRCAAEQLEMTEEQAAGNLVSRTEDYLTGAALVSLPGSISVLRGAQGLMPLAERVNLVGRSVEAVAAMACEEAAQTEADRGGDGPRGAAAPVVEWWAEELTVLRVDVFKRVVAAMKARGFKEYALGPLLMLYAQKALRGLEVFGKGGRRRTEAKKEHEKRVVLETVVGLLPRERHAISVSFLAVLLRAAVHLETTVACRLDLERRVALQLGHAVLDDLLIPCSGTAGAAAPATAPSSSPGGDTVFDLDTVQRILLNYLEITSGGGGGGGAEGGGSGRFGGDVDGGWASSPPPASDMEQVGALMEGYLAEIASDPNLSVSRFVNFAELIPEQARTTEDGMYRSLDIYLKAHPSLSEAERKKVCGVMDCQKLSREACAHAAQNSRLPVHVVVQVLYYEQQRLRHHAAAATPGAGGASPSLSHRGTPAVSTPGGSFTPATGGASPALSHRGTPAAAAAVQHHRPDYLGPPAVDELSRLRRENADLKLELVRMRMQMKERDGAGAAADTAAAAHSSAVVASPHRGGGDGSVVPMGSADKPPLPRKSIMSNVSKKLGKLNPFLRTDGGGAPRPPAPGKGRTKPPKDRRHSIS